jgi:K+-sensing histidine kinase KdpD
MKDDLMKMIVHDLKSPLAAMLGTLEMAAEGDLGPTNEQQHGSSPTPSSAEPTRSA